MGCDIHLYVEKKIDGQWISQDKWTKDDDSISVSYGDRFYGDRNYDLFAILADVRNGYGFAGIETGEGFNPISKPKGVPGDASQQYLKVVEQWDCDGHSHSYFTLRELLNYDWTQVTKLQGFVNLEQFIKFMGKSEFSDSPGPESYCGGVDGRLIVKLDIATATGLYNKAKDQLWEQRKADPKKLCMVKIGQTRWLS